MKAGVSQKITKIFASSLFLLKFKLHTIRERSTDSPDQLLEDVEQCEASRE